MPEDGLAFSRTGSKIPRWQMLQYLQSTGRRGTLLIAAILIPTAQQLINKQWERFILQYRRAHERTGLMSFRHSISSNSFLSAGLQFNKVIDFPSVSTVHSSSSYSLIFVGTRCSPYGCFPMNSFNNRARKDFTCTTSILVIIHLLF